MEVFFLFLLIFIMIIALGSGFPLAFALPGCAILTIFIAGLSGYLIEGNANEYFVSDGPFQWLNAGITNFRGVYWEVERDTLIAIPLFIFMGIMLEKSKIAEDLLISMGQLFGPVPGGLGISVIFVGALLAATTGIVGATVVAMGLISLPAMMKNNYNKSLASGIVCSSGTLGQIIPPSIVLIILSDQLASASDAADNLRIAEYKNATGSLNIPSQFSVDSVSAGNMFLGAFLPGLVLVSLYMLYVLFVGIFNKEERRMELNMLKTSSESTVNVKVILDLFNYLKYGLYKPVDVHDATDVNFTVCAYLIRLNHFMVEDVISQ